MMQKIMQIQVRVNVQVQLKTGVLFLADKCGALKWSAIMALYQALMGLAFRDARKREWLWLS